MKTLRAACNAVVLAAVVVAGLAAGLFGAVPVAQAASAAATPVAVYDFCAQWPAGAARIDAGYLRYFQGEDGVLMSAADLSPMPPTDEADRVALRRLVAALARRGTQLVVVVPPPRSMLTPEVVGPAFQAYRRVGLQAQRESYHRMVAAMSASGAIVPDLLAGVLAAGDTERLSFYRAQDLHWRAEGARLAAALTAKAIQAKVDLSAYPERRFVSRKAATAPYRGKLREAIDAVCKVPMRVDTESVYVTETAGDVAGSMLDLLGDSGQAVVLAGTSFSRAGAPSNFDGFLSEALSREVVNVAVTGGGTTVSILSYFASGEYVSAPPAVLVWEVRGHELPDAQLLDRLVSTLEDGCAPPAALATASVPLDRGQVQLLALTDQQRAVSTRAHFLDVATGGTGLNKFRLRLAYADLTHEDVQVDQTRSTVGADRYRFAITPQQLRRLQSVSLRPAATLRGDVTATLCPAAL